MLSKIPKFMKILAGLTVFATIAATLSCSSAGSGTQRTRSGLPLRAFVSNPVHPSALGGGFPALEVMDATKDLLSGFTVSLSTAGSTLADAGMMSVSPNRDRTLVFRRRDSRLGVVDNTREGFAGSFPLPGTSESFFIWTDNLSAFIAVPNGQVAGQAPGVVEQLNTANGTVTASLPIPGAHYVVSSPDGSQILLFSEHVDPGVLLTPSLIGAAGQIATISQCPTTQVQACTLPVTFDRPVGAVFDPNGATAYVLNCGLECGGTTAGVAAIDMTNTGNPGSVLLATPTLLAGATTALLQGNQLYVAGTQAGNGGILSVLSMASGITAVDCTPATPANCATFPITDGYHNKIQLGANGQLFVGARFCTAECLAIFDTTKSSVILPSLTGDVTGIEPIPNRSVVYVCQGGLLRVYDTTTDQLEKIKTFGQPDIIGQAIDVKVVDF